MKKKNWQILTKLTDYAVKAYPPEKRGKMRNKIYVELLRVMKKEGVQAAQNRAKDYYGMLLDDLPF